MSGRRELGPWRSSSKLIYLCKEYQLDGSGANRPLLEVLCGPLLNYQHMSEEKAVLTWHGSVLLVTKPNSGQPVLELKSKGPVAESANTNGFFSSAPKIQAVKGLRLYSDPEKAFWRFSLSVPLGDVEAKWQYTIPNMRFTSEVSTSASREFVVPSSHQSMRIMFHSCNGFSVGTDTDFWSGQFHQSRFQRIQKPPRADEIHRSSSVERCSADT